MDLILLTVGPPLLILFYIIKSDKFTEPASAVIKIFFLGLILIIPAGYLNGRFVTLETAYLAGITEESLKYLAFIFFVTKLHEFDERMDAIVYGTLISLGFATWENYEYVYLMFPEVDSYYIAILRAYSAIPLHAMCGVIMGYHLGLYYFNGEFVKQCLHFKLHALFKFISIPRCLVPISPSFFITALRKLISFFAAIGLSKIDIFSFS